MPNNDQVKMAVYEYSDFSVLLTNFIMADSYAGGKPATSLGQSR